MKYHISPEDTCPTCDRPREWIECDVPGCEDGVITGETLMEEDPLWYGPDDVEMCEQCAGRGGWWVCPHCAAEASRKETEE